MTGRGPLHGVGQIVVVEHLRDLPNIAAFGPGAWHFYPGAEWLRRAAGAGFGMPSVRTVTPFVHVLAFQR